MLGQGQDSDLHLFEREFVRKEFHHHVTKNVVFLFLFNIVLIIWNGITIRHSQCASDEQKYLVARRCCISAAQFIHNENCFCLRVDHTFRCLFVYISHVYRKIGVVWVPQSLLRKNFYEKSIEFATFIARRIKNGKCVLPYTNTHTQHEMLWRIFHLFIHHNLANFHNFLPINREIASHSAHLSHILSLSP